MIILGGFVTIHSPDAFKIVDDQGNIFLGASQMWYGKYWQRQAGCGPTTGTNLLWYLSKTRHKGTALSKGVRNRKMELLRLMENVWEYLTPGVMGVNSTKQFSDGLKQYGKTYNVHLNCHILDIPMNESARPSIEQVSLFLAEMLSRDLPIAFLNLSNGRVWNLDNWHWVTLTGFDAERKVALMYDQGTSREIDLALWLSSTVLGGGFVTADI